MALTDPGNYVIVRSSPSGVWAGYIVALHGKDTPTSSIELRDARRLWRWWAAEGVSISGVAAKGLHPKKLRECRIAVPVTGVVVNDVCEVISASDEARASIEAAEASAS